MASTNHVDPEVILQFWFGELDADGCADKAHQQRWWSKDPALDAELRDRFGATHAALSEGKLEAWLSQPRSRLAYIVVLDQFSRNMFRDSAAMFAYDAQALRAVCAGLDEGHDRQLAVDERGMFYMPLMHSEDLAMQERCVVLFQQLADETTGVVRAGMLSRIGFAERHREIIKKFGRFPHRNGLLGRPSTADETEFLKQPGSSF